MRLELKRFRRRFAKENCRKFSGNAIGLECCRRITHQTKGDPEEFHQKFIDISVQLMLQHPIKNSRRLTNVLTPSQNSNFENACRSRMRPMTCPMGIYLFISFERLSWILRILKTSKDEWPNRMPEASSQSDEIKKNAPNHDLNRRKIRLFD